MVTVDYAPTVPHTGSMVDGWLTVNQVAELVGVHPETVRHHCRQQTIPAVKMGRDWMIRAEDVDKLRDLKPGPKPKR